MDLLPRTHDPAHLQLLHTAVGAGPELSARGARVRDEEALQVGVVSQSMELVSCGHLEVKQPTCGANYSRPAGIAGLY